jgi:hypothetical protein
MESKGFKGLMGSKKFWVFLVGIIAEVIVSTKWINIPPETLDNLMLAIGSLTGVTVASQGVADMGKEKAKIEVEGKKK